MHRLERLLLATAAAWEKDGIAHGEIRPVIGMLLFTYFLPFLYDFSFDLFHPLLHEEGYN